MNNRERAQAIAHRWFDTLSTSLDSQEGRILASQPAFRALARKSIDESLSKICIDESNPAFLKAIRTEHQEYLDTMARCQSYLGLNDEQRSSVAEAFFGQSMRQTEEANTLTFADSALGAKCMFMLEFELFGAEAAQERMLGKLINEYISCCQEYYRELPLMAREKRGEPLSSEEVARFRRLHAWKEVFERAFRLEEPITKEFILRAFG